MNTITHLEGYIGVAVNLVNYDEIYKNIITNQLGNVIVAKDINSALNISKNKFKI